jgi:HSP20 family molecular chaperone IbpA|tara:strand:+ start:484 stop:882 length:399 start_codon:yes stop_codon:yes gene_type:complete
MYTFLNGFRPVTQARRINNNIDSILKDPFWDEFDNFFTKPSKGWHCIKEDDKWILEMAIPGLVKEDLKVKMIKGELGIISENEDNVWLGSFDKRFTLPQDVNTKKIKAKVENGVLTLTLPIKENIENSIDIK